MHFSAVFIPSVYEKCIIGNMADLMMEDYLELMDELLEKAQSIPLSGKKALVDVEQLSDYILNIRMCMAPEITQAKKIVNERKAIVEEAKKNAEDIIRKAESRANSLVDNHEITKAAQAKAIEIEKQALAKSRAIKSATDEYITNTLAKAEEVLAANLASVRKTKSTIKSPVSNPNVPNNINMQR